MASIGICIRRRRRSLRDPRAAIRNRFRDNGAMTIDQDFRPFCALTIAGSDSGGGAGIQADLKTFAAHRVHGLSAIAALTAQHTRGVTAVHVPDTGFLRAQIDACFDDFRIGAVKLGMLANAEVIHAVADALDHYRPAHIVLDPVMVATSGARLLEPEALDALRNRLMPLASLITPNLPEAELLLGHRVADGEAMQSACVELLGAGARAVLLKGGHLEDGGDVVDLLADGDNHGSIESIRHPRLAIDAHGTGCTLASAVAAGLALGRPLSQACIDASDYVHRALRGGYRPGRGYVVVLDHFGAAPTMPTGRPGEAG
jgi:hydroxymethylpyrimidine/phosphomethylpyrimidine kinase